MFVRLKKIKDYSYLLIVQNQREGKKNRQDVICNLGRVDVLQEQGLVDGLLRALGPYSDKYILQEK
ncbi:MAG: hypothetical protein LBU79_04190 [Planctomycetota bacterium]|jgi:hypothetical protein|nr:hypothetical protein [Planctomycetota bacterium]